MGEHKKPRKAKEQKSEEVTKEEMKRFWEHNIHPITGFKRETMRTERVLYTSYYLDKTKL